MCFQISRLDTVTGENSIEQGSQDLDRNWLACNSVGQGTVFWGSPLFVAQSMPILTVATEALVPATNLTISKLNFK